MAVLDSLTEMIRGNPSFATTAALLWPRIDCRNREEGIRLPAPAALASLRVRDVEKYPRSHAASIRCLVNAITSSAAAISKGAAETCDGESGGAN